MIGIFARNKNVVYLNSRVETSRNVNAARSSEGDRATQKDKPLMGAHRDRWRCMNNNSNVC